MRHLLGYDNNLHAGLGDQVTYVASLYKELLHITAFVWGII